MLHGAASVTALLMCVDVNRRYCCSAADGTVEVRLVSLVNRPPGPVRNGSLVHRALRHRADFTREAGSRIRPLGPVRLAHCVDLTYVFHHIWFVCLESSDQGQDKRTQKAKTSEAENKDTN